MASLLDPPPPVPSFEARLHETNVVYVEQQLEHARETDKYAVDYGMLTLRTLILVNGGAVIGIITFLGHFPRYAEHSNLLWWSFTWLLAGVISGLLAAAFSYLTQISFAQGWQFNAMAVYLETLGKESKQPRDEEVRANKRGLGRRLVVLFAATLSIIAFSVGSFLALSVVTNPGAAQRQPAPATSSPPTVQPRASPAQRTPVEQSKAPSRPTGVSPQQQQTPAGAQ